MIHITESGVYAGSLAGRGSSYYLVPQGTNEVMLDGEVWKTLLLGYDSWTTIPPGTFLNMRPAPANPNGGLYHGFMEIFFDNNTAIYDYDNTNAITNPNLIDFYSLALHEAIHILGFAGLIDADGVSRLRSTISGVPGCDRCYTRFDGYLDETNTGGPQNLINDANPLIPIFQLTPTQAVTQLSPGCNSSFFNPIEYNGFNHTGQEVFSPNNFIPGSSLTHFSCACPNTTYNGLMLGCLQLGTNQRFPNQGEINVLCDLGYQPGTAWVINTGKSIASQISPIYNNNCAQTPCLIIGGNDFSDANGLQYMTTIDQQTSLPIPLVINNIFDNDIPFSSTAEILNNTVQVIQGGGTVTVSGNSITYTSSGNFNGWVILAYVPHCPNSGMNGNPTYIFIQDSPPPPPCDAWDCNLICAGNIFGTDQAIAFHRDGLRLDGNGFNLATFYTIQNSGTVASNIGFGTFTNNLINGNIPTFGGGTGTVGTGCSSSILLDGSSFAVISPNNNAFIRISSRNTPQNRDGVQFDLVNPLDANQDYTFSFWAIADPGCLDLPVVHVFGTNTTTIGTVNINLPTVLGVPVIQGGGDVELIGISNPVPHLLNGPNGTQIWNQYFFTIPNSNISNNNYNRIYITLQSSAGVETSAFLDEFELFCDNSVELDITATTSTPYPCINQGNLDPITISYEVCATNLNGTAITQNDDIVLEVDLGNNPNFTVQGGGSFNALGELTIPSGTLTAANPCMTYTITLFAGTPNTIVGGTPLNFPLSLSSLGTSCIDASLAMTDVDITAIDQFPMTITKSVSPGPHFVGQPVTYTIVVCNPFNVPFNNIRVRDVLSSDLTFDALASPDFFIVGTTGNNNVVIRTPSFSLPAGGALNTACTTFTFVATPLTGVPDCVTPNNSHRIRNRARLSILGSQCPAILSNTVDIFPSASSTILIPASVSTLSQAINMNLLLPGNLSSGTAQQVAIEGSLLMDVGNGSNIGYTFANNSEIVMYPGAEMIIPAEQRVFLNETHVHGCSQMWRRILVKSNGTLDVANKTIIEQGEYAIELEEKAVYFISSSFFRDNYVGMYVAPSANVKSISGTLNKTTFEGTGTASFLPAYSGQSTNPDTWPFAGIEFHDVVALNLIKSTDNLFQNMSSGIQVYNTNLTIKQGARFENMKTVASYGTFPPTNVGILAFNTSGHQELVMDGFGIGAAAPYSFLKCNFGIYTIGGVQSTILNNRMEMDLNLPNPGGIVILGAKQKALQIENNKILSSQAGIVLFQNDDALTTTNVSNNEISLVNGSFMGGISVWEAGIPYAPNIKNNLIELDDARAGILLLNQVGASVAANDIDLLNNVPSGVLGFTGYSNRSGILTGGSSNQTFTCNIIEGGPNATTGDALAYDLSPFIPLFGAVANNNNRDVFGIRAWLSGGNQYQCNQFDLIPNGIQVAGTPSVSQIEGSRFDRVSRGIWLTAGAQTGIQSHNGNRWVWSPNTFLLNNVPSPLLDAMGLGTQNDELFLGSIIQSRFEYDFSTNIEFEPFRIISVSPAAWFPQTSDLGNSFTCNGFCNLPVPLVNLSIVDQGVVNGNFQTTTFPQTALFEANCVTYGKLKKNPNLAPVGSPEATFVTTLSQQCEGAFYDVEEACENLSSMPVSTQTQLQIEEIQINIDLEELYRLDSLSIVDTMHRDSLRLLASNQGQLLQPILQQNKQTWSTLKNVRDNRANASRTNNDVINTNRLAEQNLKKVNRIYLKTIAKEDFIYTNNQLQKLHAIALQCPLEGGVAVYKARSMVTFFTQVDYETLQNCNPNSNARLNKSEEEIVEIENEIKLYPNPTDEEVTLEWEYINDKVNLDRKMMIYNALGQLVYTNTVQDATTKINTSSWAAGLYFCQLYENGAFVKSKKLTIVKL